MRVSLKVANPRVGEKRPAEDIECSSEHSKMIMGPAVEQALTLFSTEVEEGRRVTDTVVNIQNEGKEDNYARGHSAALTLPASAPAAPSVPSTLAVPQLQCSADPIPPFEVISRRRDSKVVNKTSLASVAHSPSPKTTRKWSNPSYAPARVDGGGQLARAAAYIRERTTRRSPAFDEFVCRTPKGPPDRMTESESIRQPALLAVSKAETSAQSHSPIPLAALAMPALSPAFLSQADSIDEPSMELSRPVSKPGIAQVSLPHLPSLEGWWRARCKPPNVVVEPKRCSDSVVNRSFDSSATKHLPSSEAASVLPIPSSVCSSQISTPTSRPSGLELVWWERIKPPNKVAYRWLLYEAVNTLNKRADSVTHLGWNATTPRRSLCSSFLQPLLRIAGRGRQTSRCPRLLAAAFGQLQ